MEKNPYLDLSRRESQIADIVFRLGKASVADVLKELPDPPGYNSVRVTLSVLEKKGYINHYMDGQRYIYQPTFIPARAKRSLLSHLKKTFFGGSASSVLATLLDVSSDELSEEEIDELSSMIEDAKKMVKK